MNSNKNSPAQSETGRKAAANGLNLSPEQAKREAKKLHELRDNLAERETPESTDARTSPLGRRN